MMNDEYEHFGVKTNNSLMHSKGPWKKHKYISKGPNGYVYAHEPSNRVHDYASNSDESWANRFDKRKKRQKAGKLIKGIDKALPNLGKQSRHNKAKNKLAAERALISGYNKLRNRILENRYKPNSGQNIAKELQDLNEIIRLSNSKILERAIYGDDE